MKTFALIPGFALAVTVCSVRADTNPPALHEHPVAQAEAYAPGLGEVMALQQMRHAKLWLAGLHRNWALADYELDELKEGFEDAARLHPTQDSVPVAEMIAKLTPGPLQLIGKAIKAKSAKEFASSFDSLTATCNTCHQAASHGFIRISRPSGSTFSNQDFTTRKN